MDGLAYMDGRIVPLAEAKVPLLDWGFLRSDACQDTVSVWNGAFFRLDDHIERFLRSCARLRLTAPERSELVRTLDRLVAASGLRRAYVQMLVTRGLSAPGSRDPRSCRNSFMAFCLPYITIAPKSAAGLRLKISERTRIAPQSVPSDIKNYHWIDFELALFDALEAGFDSTVLIDAEGDVTEGPGFNIFASVAGELVTPGFNMLQGITRRTVIELAAELGIPCRIAPLSPQALRTAEEAFACSTAGGIVPVTEVDGRRLGEGAPGPRTSLLHAEYWQRREAGWLGTPVGYEAAETVLAGEAS